LRKPLQKAKYNFLRYVMPFGLEVEVFQRVVDRSSATIRSRVIRPSLDLMWIRFKDVEPVYPENYPDGVAASLRKVGEKIGGHVKMNFDKGALEIEQNPDPRNYPAHPVGFTNACATRLSYVLNYSGVPIPKSNLWESVSGADHKNYIYKVKGIKTFLLQTFGEPDIQKGFGARPGDFTGKKGIIVFDVAFPDASGHATLWNGVRAVDEDYFSPRSGIQLGGVRLWVCA
jgi:Type VI secretion system (T6SS), amidase effector protein 4